MDIQSKKTGEENERDPLTDNEAIKNTDDVGRDKLQKDNINKPAPPGYPGYPASEDLLNPSNTTERADVDVERISRAGRVADEVPASGSTISTHDMELPETGDLDDDEDLGIVEGTEADVTKEDLLILGPKDQDMDMGEDEDVKGGFPLELTGEDLDVPGEELDDPNEDIGEEDEENNYYSLGGDNHESLEEDQAGQQE
jgi:hypothetical protein